MNGTNKTRAKYRTDSKATTKTGIKEMENSAIVRGNFKGSAPAT